MHVPVDALMLASHDSSFLQQASFLTGGVYHRPASMQSLLTFMFTHCLPTAAQRKILKLPLAVLPLLFLL